jgi:uncharacterized protein (DUF302 family)
MRALKLLSLTAALAMTAVTAAAQTPDPIPEKYSFPAPTLREHRPNTMMEPITAEARTRFIQAMMAGNPLSVRDMINLMAYKVKADPGLAYDDIVASMKQRANKLNFKFVGSNPIYKDVTAIGGQETPRVEIFNFCDAMVARELLDYSLEFAIFLPCRIAAVEDADKQIWLLMLDWDAVWMDTSPNPDRMPDSLRQSAIRLRRGMIEIMTAGAKGDL